MQRLRHVLICALLVPLTCGAQTAQLAPAPERITDGVIQRDHRAYEALQARISALNDGKRPVSDYQLSKAQCWLDISFHEYTRNDRSAFPQEALTQAERLVIAIEQRQDPLPWDTPLVNDAAKLRPDLWERAATLRTHAGFACAQQRAACAEVELVHAGNEIKQQGWRHAKPYIQIAEDNIADAEHLASLCTRSVAQPATSVSVPAAVPKPKQPLSAAVVFNFDRYAQSDIRPQGMEQLTDLLTRIRKDGLIVEHVELVGHADRLNATGKADYNQQLARRRVDTVHRLLLSHGIESAAIHSDARGDTLPLASCEGQFKNRHNLHECLLPNRRVEVLITTR